MARSVVEGLGVVAVGSLLLLLLCLLLGGLEPAAVCDCSVPDLLCACCAADALLVESVDLAAAFAACC